MARVNSLVSRSVTADQVRSVTARDDLLFELDWCPMVAVGEPVGLVEVAELGELGGQGVGGVVVRVGGSGGGVVENTHAVVAGVLGLVQQWLAQQRWEGLPLVVVTCGAAAVGGVVTDVAGAACGGWCARRSRSMRDGSCWSTWTRTVMGSCWPGR